MDIPILYEDENCLVINKPAGVVVHPDGKTKEFSVTEWFLKKYPELKEVGEPLKLANGEVIWRPGIVHRLDRDTSGVLLIAKNNEAFQFFKTQFQERATKKIYRAFVWGEMKDSVGIIDRPIGRNKNDFRQWTAEDNSRGVMREATTEYKVLAYGKGFSYVEVTPKTGRTHQIRVHFKAIGHPLVCDGLYAPKREAALGFDRLALHALSLTVPLPKGGERTFEAPLPFSFINAEKEIKDA